MCCTWRSRVRCSNAIIMLQVRDSHAFLLSFRSLKSHQMRESLHARPSSSSPFMAVSRISRKMKSTRMLLPKFCASIRQERHRTAPQRIPSQSREKSLKSSLLVYCQRMFLSLTRRARILFCRFLPEHSPYRSQKLPHFAWRN